VMYQSRTAPRASALKKSQCQVSIRIVEPFT
jgi:hypothetical protein